MSIPKEPRQLMINLMYLVLTALLALNVSAEVMNAFFSLDKGMANSGKIVDRTNDALMANINQQADAYKTETNKKYAQNAAAAKQVTDEFVAYIEDIRTRLFEKAGGPNPKVPGQPKDIRNKDITTKMFINDGLGAQIEAKINETRQKLLELADGDKEVEAGLPLAVEVIPEGVKSRNWPEYKFKQMPVAALFPVLGKMQSDAKNSYSAILNYCAKKVGGQEIRMDSYEPVVSAPKSYMISGETYEADVFLSAYSSTANNISISVNGNGLPVQGGKAHYTARADGIGTKKFGVTVNVKNPLTGEVKTYQKDFTYEVGQRSIAVALEKMNVFYIGVDNPVAISAAGINTGDLRVSANGVSINKVNGSNYVVRGTTPTNDASITVSGPGVSQTFKYRVKRIPDPVATLGMKFRGGSIGNGEFKAQGGIIPVLENFDFEAKCEVMGFTVTYLAKRQDPSPPISNSGARWNGQVQDMINRAKPGDSYFFDDIKVKCPGDGAGRNIGSLAFKIK